MKKISLLFFVVVFTSQIFSQEISFLKGAVLNDSISVVDITVTNKNLKQSTKTNDFGTFELPVRLGDSIMVAAIHINPVTLIITDEVLKAGEISVEVSEKLNEMETVVLNNLISTSALNFNVGPTTNPDPEKLKREEIKKLANTDPTKKFEGLNIIGLVSSAYKWITKNSKKLSKQEKRLRFEKFKVNFSKEFGNSFFTDDLKISELKIEEFLSFCNQKKSLYDMYSNNEKLELIDFLIKQSKEYKKIMKIDN
ncbi:hypothetical protein AXE80_04180 [Wenyingzhuangia fucanilytica]|uniref:Carboxypeptidase-like regulatory domain-containing protein n=1 Tax=Wenyingzhuangia fucanilytica TaxID=1790137 RepID=A0A1B1Y464_9FLAO|nr:hypothetical protein [Wenyingzhuangia fucanilytica]ANW95527.1 hypothetical protein AXE80_04180 [Wenyingzhuangia fucanilytica]